MGLALKFCIITVVLLAIILNPGPGSFNHWFMESARWKLEDKAAVSDIEDAVKSHVYENVEVIKRSNRIVYSLYTIPSESGKLYKYIGFMGSFIRID